MKFSPIVIFAYNRPNHLLNLLNSLFLNQNITKHGFFFFCDGPKNFKDKKNITLIKKIINRFKKKLKFRKIFYNKKNAGLAKNIINGVTEVLKKNPYCIVLEDDLVVNSETINFLNHYLKLLKNNSHFGSVSAHSYLDKMKELDKKEYYTTRRHCSWCWGTWSRVWNGIDWNSINYQKHFLNKSEKKLFSLAGNDLNLLLWGQDKKYINSWAIRFNYFCFKKNLLSFQPRYSMIENRGRDSSGTHERFSISSDKIDINYFPKLLKKINPSKFSSKKIDLFIKNKHRKSLKLLIMHFFQERYFL
jgi:GR25 family glycosyltransferase involved in LPS biosynthesis